MLNCKVPLIYIASMFFKLIRCTGIHLFCPEMGIVQHVSIILMKVLESLLGFVCGFAQVEYPLGEPNQEK